MKKKHFSIYKSVRHVYMTALIIIVPFIFLFLFSRFAKITLFDLLGTLIVSFGRLAVAYIAAALIGFTLAVIFYRGRRGDFALPVFDVLQSFPTSAALPVAALVFGVNSLTVIFFLALQIIWPILFSLVGSLKLVKHEWEESVEIGGLQGFNYFRYFLLPVSTPALITGSIIGLGEAWEALVATEIIIGIKNGLGGFFLSFAGSGTITIFGILALLIVIFSINKILWLPLLERSHRMLEE